MTSPPALHACFAAVPYTFPWAGLVQQFKFDGHIAWARTLADLMRATPWAEPALDAADVVVPMPLSDVRMRERGFNQSALLARQLAPAVTRDDVLLRVLHSPPQSSLPRHARLANVQSAYAVEPAVFSELRALRVVLVDDVMTSGASINAAAQVLRQAGAAHVSGLVFARTDAPSFS